MWILLLLATFVSIIAFNTKHQRLALLIITFLGTSAFQLLSVRWFASPVILSKPYDYAYLAILGILLLNINKVVKLISTDRVALITTAYLVFIVFVLVISIAVLSYSPVQAFQSARVFVWPVFFLVFMITEKMALERFARTLVPIVIFLSILYLLQPLTGTNIINPDSFYFNPYLGSTDLKRYLATPDFLIFFVMWLYFDLCKSSDKKISTFFMRALGLALLTAVQIVSFTRSAITGTGLVLVYLSKRILNSVLVIFFMLSVLVLGAIAYSSSTTVETRVDDSWKDITTSLSGDYLNFRPGTDGNLSFRLAHLNERVVYVASDIKLWPLGVGFIHEESDTAQNLGFKIGLKNIFTGRAVQVDTGDIAWSVIVIKTGFLGLAILLALLLVSYFSVSSGPEKYAVIYRGGLLYYFLTSFFSINFVMPSYMIPLMLFLALAINENKALAPITTFKRKTRVQRS